MVDSEQALAYGIVDDIADAGDVLARSLRWLQETLALPSGPMQATRAIARADVRAALDGFDAGQLAWFIEGWYSADTQRALQAVLARLKK
jgi:enoyl-CoA hydratase/carnithine racemase